MTPAGIYKNRDPLFQDSLTLDKLSRFRVLSKVISKFY